jgi:hypothetical protein
LISALFGLGHLVLAMKREYSDTPFVHSQNALHGFHPSEKALGMALDGLFVVSSVSAFRIDCIFSLSRVCREIAYLY